MTELIEDYLRELASRLPLDPERKEQVVSEMRVHLVEKVDELQRVEPGLSRDDAMRRAVNDFGTPTEVAAGFAEAAPPPAGEPEARAPRRKRLLVGLAIFLALNFVGGGVAAWVSWTAEDEPRKPNADEFPLYKEAFKTLEYGRRCDDPCNANLTRSFYVRADDEGLGLMAFAIWDSEPPRGAVRIRLLDPLGDERIQGTIDRSLWESQGAEHAVDGGPWASISAELSEDPGNWTLTVEFVDFVGSFDAWARVYRWPSEEQVPSSDVDDAGGTPGHK